MPEFKRLFAKAAGYAQATWFWHTWVAGIITLFFGLLVPWTVAAWMAWTFMLAREIRDVGAHIQAKDEPWGLDGWVLDGVLDMVGPTLIVRLAYLFTYNMGV